MIIEKTEPRYLDGVEYVRVFWADSIFYEDIRADFYEEWKGELGHREEFEVDKLTVSDLFEVWLSFDVSDRKSVLEMMNRREAYDDFEREVLSRGAEKKASLRTVCLGALPKYKVVLDAAGIPDRAGLKVVLLRMNKKQELARILVATDKDGKVDAREGSYLMVTLAGGRVDHQIYMLMEVDSSGHDSHRYSVECIIDGKFSMKKLPTAMMLGVFDTESELMVFAETRMLQGL